MKSQEFNNYSFFTNFFAHHLVALWLFIFACSFSVHAQSYTISRSSIGHHLGSIAIPETPICVRLSEMGIQLAPSSIDFQMPPAGAPT